MQCFLRVYKVRTFRDPKPTKIKFKKTHTEFPEDYNPYIISTSVKNAGILGGGSLLPSFIFRHFWVTHRLT